MDIVLKIEFKHNGSCAIDFVQRFMSNSIYDDGRY